MNLSEINWDHNAAGSWPLEIKMVVIFIICCLLVGAGVYQVTMPQLKQLDNLAQTEQTLKEEFEKKQKQAANLAAYEEQFKKIETLLAQMVKQMPSESEVAALLRKVSRKSHESGLESRLFETEEPERRDFYFELPTKIEMLGKYNELGVFISSLTTLSRIVTVHDITIAPVEKTDTVDDRMEMKAIVRTYKEAPTENEVDDELADEK
jgi:type IV pilus assembly protein PilO